jgi:hypothetical protein
MKELAIISTCLLAYVVNVYAQGTVIFNNHLPGIIVSHVYGPAPGDPTHVFQGNGPNDFPAGNTIYNGPLLSGTEFSAQLWAAPGANAPEGSLLPASPITSFGTGANAGFLIATIATLQGVPADASAATIQLRVWDNYGGLFQTWGEAVSAFKSPLFTVDAIGGLVNPPPPLIGLQSFSITGVIPEPTTLTLTVLGLALVGCRRLTFRGANYTMQRMRAKRLGQRHFKRFWRLARHR